MELAQLDRTTWFAARVRMNAIAKRKQLLFATNFLVMLTLD